MAGLPVSMRIGYPVGEIVLTTTSSSAALKYSCLILSGNPHSFVTVKRVATCTAAAPFSR